MGKLSHMSAMAGSKRNTSSVQEGSSSQSKSSQQLAVEKRANAIVKKNHARLKKNTSSYEKFRRLALGKVEKPRYLHNPTLAELGILVDVRNCFHEVNLGDFIDICPPAYDGLTLEFFSILDMGNLLGAANSCIRFQLGGVDHEINLHEFATIFHLPPPLDDAVAINREVDPELFEEQFWVRIASGGLVEYRSIKAAKIFHPVFRYIHRVLAMGMFARGDSIGVVEKFELRIMNAMFDGRVPLDIAAYFTLHLNGMTNSARTSHKIFVGGLVTQIAQYLGVQAHRSDSPILPKWIDVPQLVQMKMMTVRNNVNIWIYQPC